MAYGLKYTHSFHQLKDYGNSSEWKLEIYLEGYVGASSEIDHILKNSITMSKEGDLLNVVQGTKLTFSILNESEAQYKEFRTANWGDYKVILIKDPNGTPLTKFIGYNQSEIYTEPFDQPPYSAKLEFTCGLNHLKHVKWQPASIVDTGVNTNSTSTVSSGTALPTQFEYIFIEIEDSSGDHSNHVITLQWSTDNVVWGDSDYSITGLGNFFAYKQTGPLYYRLKVTTAEGAISFVNWKTTIIHYGQKSIIEVLRLALNHLPSPLPIREFVNVYENSINSTTTDSMLNQIFVDSSVYKKALGDEDEEEESEIVTISEEAFSCSKTIDTALKVFGVNVFQNEGYWYIMRVQEYSDSTLYYREFNANVGTESTITVDGTGNITTNKRTVTGPNGASNELVLVAPETEMSILPPMNRVQVTYSQDNIDQESHSIIKGGKFLQWNPVTTGYPLPNGWGFVGCDPNLYDARTFERANFNIWMFSFDTVEQSTASSINTGIYMGQEWLSFGVSTSDSLVLEFKTVVYSSINALGTAAGGVGPTPIVDFIEKTWQVDYPMHIQFGNYYLQGDNITGYFWTLTTGYATFTHYGAYAVNRGSNSNLQNYAAKIAETIKVVLPNFPVTTYGDFVYRLYRPYTNMKTLEDSNSTIYTRGGDQIRIGELTLTYLPDELPPKEQLILNSKINEDENVTSIKVAHGDGTNSSTLNSFRLASGLITDFWTRRGVSESQGILFVLLEQLAEMQGAFVKELSGSLIGEIDVFNTIEHTTDVTVHYYIKGYEWDICQSIYTVLLSEMWGDATPIINKNDALSGANSLGTTPSNVGSVPTTPTEPVDDGGEVTSGSTVTASQPAINNYV